MPKAVSSTASSAARARVVVESAERRAILAAAREWRARLARPGRGVDVLLWDDLSPLPNCETGIDLLYRTRRAGVSVDGRQVVRTAELTQRVAELEASVPPGDDVARLAGLVDLATEHFVAAPWLGVSTGADPPFGALIGRIRAHVRDTWMPRLDVDAICAAFALGEGANATRPRPPTIARHPTKGYLPLDHDGLSNLLRGGRGAHVLSVEARRAAKELRELAAAEDRAREAGSIWEALALVDDAETLAMQGERDRELLEWAAAAARFESFVRGALAQYPPFAVYDAAMLVEAALCHGPHPLEGRLLAAGFVITNESMVRRALMARALQRLRRAVAEAFPGALRGRGLRGATRQASAPAGSRATRNEASVRIMQDERTTSLSDAILDDLRAVSEGRARVARTDAVLGWLERLRAKRSTRVKERDLIANRADLHEAWLRTRTTLLLAHVEAHVDGEAGAHVRRLATALVASAARLAQDALAHAETRSQLDPGPLTAYMTSLAAQAVDVGRRLAASWGYGGDASGWVFRVAERLGSRRPRGARGADPHGALDAVVVEGLRSTQFVAHVRGAQRGAPGELAAAERLLAVALGGAPQALVAFEFRHVERAALSMHITTSMAWPRGRNRILPFTRYELRELESLVATISSWCAFSAQLVGPILSPGELLERGFVRALRHR
jgi:hypothetical protein